jgi:hypothetical protein
MWFVWMFWRRDRSLADLPVHSEVIVLTVLSDGLEDEMKTNIKTLRSAT